MTTLAMTAVEERQIDTHLEPMMAWAATRQAEAEQLALDAARLLSCTGDRMDRLSKQGFFRRCWSRFMGETAALEHANTADLVHMQKTAFRYVNILQERQLLMAHSMLSLRNNLISLAVKEEETRNLITSLADNTLRRFKNLEKRMDQLEISQNLQGWLLGLEERDYDVEYPTPYMRMLRIVNDFYGYKPDNWNYNDILFMAKALRIVNINPKTEISMHDFINNCVDEIQTQGFEPYHELLSTHSGGYIKFDAFMVDNVSSQAPTVVYGLHSDYINKQDIIEDLSDQLSISPDGALKRLLLKSMERLSVDLDCRLQIKDIAVELISGLRLANKMHLDENDAVSQKAAPLPITQEQIEEVTQSEPESPQTDTVVLDYNEFEDDRVVDVTKLNNLKFTFSALPTERYVNDSLRIYPIGNGEYAIGYDSGYLCEWMSTRDFIDFEVHPGREDNYFGYRRECFLKGGMWFYMNSDLEISNNGFEWKKFKRNRYKGKSVSYKNIFHDGTYWYICGTYEDSYTYTEEGILWDSTKTSTYTCGVVFKTRDFENIVVYGFEKDFYKNALVQFEYDGKNIIAVLSESTSTACWLKRKSVYSSDCILWSKIHVSKIKSIIYDHLENKYYFFCSDDVVYKSDFLCGKNTKITKNVPLRIFFSKEKFMFNLKNKNKLLLAVRNGEGIYICMDCGDISLDTDKLETNMSEYLKRYGVKLNIPYGDIVCAEIIRSKLVVIYDDKKVAVAELPPEAFGA